MWHSTNGNIFFEKHPKRNGKEGKIGKSVNVVFSESVTCLNY